MAGRPPRQKAKNDARQQLCSVTACTVSRSIPAVLFFSRYIGVRSPRTLLILITNREVLLNVSISKTVDVVLKTKSPEAVPKTSASVSFNPADQPSIMISDF